ncbi:MULTISPECIES: NHL domain-containing protein [unclassified Lysinibacillus]|uniref:NHL domain-containing protein n=1 Tax=unclassified Lysinibacillus TaxID=2636778 RepID=UPI0030FC68E0
MKLFVSPAITAALLFSSITVFASSSRQDELVLPAYLKDGVSVSNFAGNGEYSSANGKAEATSFRKPNSIVSLSDGSILVADSKNQTIRMIKSNVVSTYAGITFDTDTHGNPLGGWHDDKKEMSVFNNPMGMAVDKNDTIFIADANNNVIRKITKDGNVATVAGDGFIGNQDGMQARFNNPQDVAVAKDGTLYVADTLNHVIRKIDTNGKVSTLNAYSDRVAQIEEGEIELAGDFADGKLVDAKFNEPSALVIDKKGNLYVSDSGNQLIRYIDFASNTVSTVAGNVTKSSTISKSTNLYADGDYKNGLALSAQFNFPKGLAITNDGGLLITDTLNHAIRYLSNGKVTTVVGGTSGSESPLYYPTDILVLPEGSLLVVDSYHNSIRFVESK